MSKLYTTDKVKEKIKQGEKLILAGDEKLLNELPEGNWIGGSIPYFMAQDGGVFTQNQIFVTEMPDYVKETTIHVYDKKNIENIYNELPEHGFSIIIMPAFSSIHQYFALNTLSFPNFATKPLAGWIAGVPFDKIGKDIPKVYNGFKGDIYEDKAVVYSAELPESKIADIQIINIFKQGEGDSIFFLEKGFKVKDALINGERQNFADYLLRNKIDNKLPFVADVFGSMLNSSLKEIDEKNKTTEFFAPVFDNTEYKLATPGGDYIQAFRGMIPDDVSADNLFFSCNCLYNYFFAELEGKKTGNFTGPAAFGEIAYQLLNQTLVYLTINDI